MLLDFAGKSVVITGASRGIGLAVAQAFHAAGATLHLLADDPAVESVAAALSARGYVVDITDDTSLTRAFEKIEGVDVLINNAGVERMTPIAEWSSAVEDDFRRVLDVNVLGTARVTARALPRMASGGAIVNTASIWGRVAEPLFGAYVASKHAVIGLTKTFARELGPKGIRVNAVCPGWVRTEAAMASLGRMSVRPHGNGAISRWALVALANNSDRRIERLLVASCGDEPRRLSLLPLCGSQVQAVIPSRGPQARRIQAASGDVFSVGLDPNSVTTFVIELAADRTPSIYLWDSDAYRRQEQDNALPRHVVIGGALLLALPI